MEKIDLTIVCCYNDINQLQNDLLKTLNEQTVACETILIDNRDKKFKSASAALNYGASLVETKYVLFSHQDIYFTDNNALKEIYEYFVELDGSVIGVAGVKLDTVGTYTTVVHGVNKIPAGRHKIKKPVKVASIDECIFGMNIDVYNKLLFDEKNFDNWHLYAIDMCYNAYSNGIEVYSIPSKIWHKSEGNLNHSFFVGFKRLRDKYGDDFDLIKSPITSLKKDENVYLKEFRILYWNDSKAQKFFSKFSKDKLTDKFLSKSNKYKYYKKNYPKLKKDNNSLKKKNKKLDKKNKQLNKKLDFINFDEFLINSYYSPIVDAPFSFEDKRCFAFMDHLSKYLVKFSENNDNPLVSVILPTYNREERVLFAINSVLNQTYSNFELIIIDDGSNDKTSEVLQSLNDERIKLILNNQNEGVSRSRNYGLNEAKGKYVAYLDSDNEWDSNYLSAMVGAFLMLPDADALYSGQILYKEFDSKPYAIRFGAYNKSLLHNRNYIDLNCFCHKLEIYNEVGGFDESLIKLVDWDLILRISNNYKIYSIPILLCKYYNHDDDLRVTHIHKKIFSEPSKAIFEILNKIIDKNKLDYRSCEELKRKVSIIIPNFESLNELKECVNSIFEFENEMVDLIIVDNNSGVEVVEYLKTLKKDNNAKIILNDINYGFTYAVNQGIEVSDENSDILLLNNDAILTDGAIRNMQRFAYDYEKCGIVVPHEILVKGNPRIKHHVPYADKRFECDTTPSKVHHNISNIPIFHDGGALELNFAPFFCTYIKRDIYNKTLGLDAELGRHYRSDRIFSDYIRHILKMKIYQCPDAFVFHKHQVATKKLKENKSKFHYMFDKNQWEPELAEKLEYSNRLWDE